ncbi:MAG TPA: hypothetical protein VKU02_04510 [Gemmataceae bacterium]|nr:hypothetical protein [Gemmataceae bacterium]
MGCRHCGRKAAGRPRGLCWTCYQTLAIRERYSPVSKFGRRGVLDFCGLGKLPTRPTPALPGSPEKVAVLEQRASRRESLWHPHDAAFGPERFSQPQLSSA